MSVLARDTPCVAIDLEKVDRNVARMQTYCDEHQLACRPHIKTHKSLAVAHRQIAAGASGIACQKVDEAAVMVAGGLSDVFITYPITGAAKLTRLAGLARVARIVVAADSAAVVSGLSEGMDSEGVEVGVLVECDTGLGRAGVQTAEEARNLAGMIEALPGLRFLGLMTYPSDEASGAALAEVKRAIESEGITVRRVSGGGTKTAFQSHTLGILTEIRPGTYVYGDRACVANGSMDWDDCALRVVTTVVSTPTKDRAILDAGSKVLTTDPVQADGQSGYGAILSRPGDEIRAVYEEHAVVECGDEGTPLTVGDVVEVIPNHACVTVNTQDAVLVHKAGRPVGMWPVHARGAVR